VEPIVFTVEGFFGLKALGQLLHSVFVAGDAAPMTSVWVMSICANLVLWGSQIPQLRRRRLRRTEVQAGEQSDQVRAIGA
jgi:hypothetical protein